jgi:hypothetical protein
MGSKGMTNQRHIFFEESTVVMEAVNIYQQFSLQRSYQHAYLPVAYKSQPGSIEEKCICCRAKGPPSKRDFAQWRTEWREVEKAKRAHSNLFYVGTSCANNHNKFRLLQI